MDFLMRTVVGLSQLLKTLWKSKSREMKLFNILKIAQS